MLKLKTRVKISARKLSFLPDKFHDDCGITIIYIVMPTQGEKWILLAFEF